VTQLSLTGGAVHTHRIFFNPNRKIDSEMLANSSTGFYKGLSNQCLIVAYGQPVELTSDHTTVTTGFVKLNCVTKRDLKYCFIVDNTSDYYGNNGLAQPAAPSGVDFVNPFTQTLTQMING
jgi:hypothetical protein